MASIAEIRQQYPAYNDLSDQELADRMHAKFYSDMPKSDFYARIGLGQPAPDSEPRAVTSADVPASGLTDAFGKAISAGEAWAGGAKAPVEPPKESGFRFIPPDIPSAIESFKVGAQGVGRGLVADTVGAPVDIVSALINGVMTLGEGGARLAGADVNLPRVTNPIGGSDNIADTALGAAEAVGYEPADTGANPGTRLAYNLNRYGSQALGTGGALMKSAPLPGEKPGPLPTLTRPYVNTPGAALTTDVASGLGAGGAITAAQEMVPEDSPWRAPTEILAGLGGGLLGAGGASLATAPGRIGYRLRMAGVDPDIPTDPDSGLPATRATVQKASNIVKSQASNPGQASANIKAAQNAAAESGIPIAGTGLVSDDPGMIGAEKAARLKNPKPFNERAVQVTQAVSDKVGSLSDPTADPRAPQRFIEADVANRRAAVQQPLADARTDLSRTQADNAGKVSMAEARRATEMQSRDTLIGDATKNVDAAVGAETGTGAAVAAQADLQMPASRRMSDAVGATKQADEATKSGLYRRAENLGRDVQIDPTRLADDASAVLKDISPLAPQTPAFANVARDLERLGARETVDTGLLDASGSAITRETTQPTTARDLVEILPRISRARDAASQARRGDTVGRLDRIANGIKQELNALADDGVEAAVAWREAESNFSGNFAPKYREGVGGAMDKAERAGRPVPPTAVGEKFIFAGPGGEEAAQNLKRILAGSANEAEGTNAARDYLRSTMAGTVGADGRVNPARLRRWAQNYRGAIDQIPGMRQEVDQMVQDVVNRRGATTRLQGDLEQAIAERKTAGANLQREIKSIEADAKLTETQKRQKVADLERQAADFERDVNRSATSLLIDADPVKAAASVFNARDPERAMREITQKVAGDPAAAAGWRRAVADHVSDLVTNTASAGVENPVSVAKLQNVLDKYAKVLAPPNGPFSPEDMNKLRQSQAALRPFTNLRMQATVGSPTAENSMLLERLAEGFLRLRYGVLKGGGIKATVTRLGDGIGSALRQTDVSAENLIQRAQLDPDLARHLLDMPDSPQLAPVWNAKLTRLLAYTNASRTMNDRVEKKDQQDEAR